MKKKTPPTSRVKTAPERENTQGLTDEELTLRAEQRKRAARKKRKKMIKTAIIVLILAIIAAIVLVWFLRIKKAEKVAESLATYTVSRRTIEEVLSATGTLQPADSYTVSASAQGDILECHFEEGDDVLEDDVLYVIDSSDMDTTLRQREISLENARDNYNDLVADRAKLRTYSKYSGTITELYVEVGDTVREDQVIADIVDKSSMLIDLPFFEVDVLAMNKGDAVTVTISGSGESLPGTVDKVSALTGVSPTGVKTRDVTIKVANPGGITKATSASGEYSADITSSGTSTFYYNVEEQILASYGGDILTLSIDEGQTINEGALVLTIDGHDLEKSIKNASQSLENAQMSYDNTIENIEDYTIKAPITGTVIEKYYNAGESIDNTGGSKTVAIIYDLSSLTFDMYIDELDIFSIEKGQEVTITSDAYSNRSFKGEITKISKVGSTSNGTTVYPVTVTISDEEALAALLPGMNIDAEIIINRVENVLAVPTGAVQRGNTVKVIKNPEKLKGNGAETPEIPEASAGTDGTTPQRPDRADNADGAMPQRPAEADGADGTMPQRPEGTDGTATEGTRPQGSFGSGFGGNRQNAGASLYGTAPGDTEYDTIKVETGISDDDYIEIVSGLEEGDVVIIESTQVSSSIFSMMGMGGMPGGMGGMPGGNMGGARPSGNMGGNRQGIR